MKKTLFILGLFLSHLAVWGQAPSLNFVKIFKDLSCIKSPVYTMTRDFDGNIVVAGVLHGTADMDPGPGTFNLVSSTSNDLYFAKYDSLGTFLWAKHIVNPASSLYAPYLGVSDVVCDQRGNIYLGGRYSRGDMDFDPDSGVVSLPHSSLGSSYTGGFIARYDKDGHFNWVRGVHHSNTVNNESCDRLALDTARGLVYAMVQMNANSGFSGSISYYTGSGSNYMSGTGTNDYCYLVTCDTSGTYVRNTGIDRYGADMALDVAGNLYVASRRPYYSTNYHMAFRRMNPNGGTYWLKLITPTTSAGEIGYISDIEVDGSGNIYLAGYFRRGYNFDANGNFVLNSADPNVYDGFLAKYDVNGNFIDAGRFGNGNGGITVRDGALDLGANQWWITGSFADTVDFDMGPGSSDLYASSAQDVFLLKYDLNLGHLWSGNLGGMNTSQSFVSLDCRGGGLLAAGSFFNTLDFDFGPGNASESSLGTNGFFARYDACSAPPASPGPIQGNVALCAGETGTFTISPVSGATAYLWSLPQGWTGNSSGLQVSLTAGQGSGTLSVSAQNACGSSAPQSLGLTAYPTYAVSVLDSICEGEVYTLGSQNLDSAGIYRDTLSTVWGCDSVVTLDLRVLGRPSVSIVASDTVLCAEDSLILMGQGAVSYVWDQGVSDGVAFAVDSSSVFEVVGSDAWGCRDTQSVAILVHPLPMVSLNLDPYDTLCVWESIFQLTGGSPLGGTYSGQGVSNGGFYAQTAGLGTHVISYTFMDTNGCEAVGYDSLSVKLCGGSEDDLNVRVRVWPQPTEQWVRIEVEGGLRMEGMALFDLQGRKLMVQAADTPREMRVDLGALPAGVYLLRLELDGEQSYVRRLVKR